ncbi:MAG: hypothetical protein J6M53_08880 [Bacteroidaceae bacterium]|nr:hypothetical protein [Bacteroidaceae bacterium]
MAEIKIDPQGAGTFIPTPGDVQPAPLGDSTATAPANDVYSEEEASDPAKIRVDVADTDSPLVVLFGPKSCGKTMTVVRLTRYLKSKGFSVDPVPSFRPTWDNNYKKLCGGFDALIYSDDAAQATDRINFMLIKVSYQGRPICQILEAPGEGYFQPGEPRHQPFPPYVDAIISSRNRKIWCVMVEPDDTNPVMTKEVRAQYADKVAQLKSKIKARDRVVFVLNKVDATPFVVAPGVVKYGLAKQSVGYNYPNIFVPFTNVNPVTRLWRPFDFDFIAYQTGTYYTAGDGTLTFTEGDDVYPRNLWNLIQKRVRG